MHRRRHGRIRAEGVVARVVTGENVTLALAVDNLSLGGAFLRTPRPLKPGTAIALDLSRPGMPSFRLQATVVNAVTPALAFQRHAQPGMGIAFQSIDASLEEKLRRLLLALAPSPTALNGDSPDVAPQPSQNEIDLARLKVQVKGLLLEVSEWQSRADALARENAWLKTEMARLRQALFGEAAGRPLS